jgi:hypothetical protein
MGDPTGWHRNQPNGVWLGAGQGCRIGEVLGLEDSP